MSVTRPPLFTEPKDWSFLAAGVDSLDVGLHVDWSPCSSWLFDSLERGKLLAAGTKGIPWGNDGACLILPGGKPPLYSFHLQWPGYHVFLNRGGVSHTPNVYVSLGSSLLWSQWIPHCFDEPVERIQAIGGDIKQLKPSRMDLCADFLLPAGLDFDFLRYCRSPKQYKQRNEFDGDQLETYYLGSRKSPIQLRVYDKGREIHHGGTKYWMADIWELDSVDNVWRLEFQLRREALRQFKIHDTDTLVESLPGVWNALTEKWITLRDRSADKNITRCPIHPFWTSVIEAGRALGEFKPVSRDRTTSAASVDWYVAHMAGLTSSFAARTGHPNLDAALQVLTAAIRARAASEWRLKYFQKSVQLGIDPGYVINDEMEKPNADS